MHDILDDIYCRWVYAIPEKLRAINTTQKLPSSDLHGHPKLRGVLAVTEQTPCIHGLRFSQMTCQSRDAIVVVMGHDRRPLMCALVYRIVQQEVLFVTRRAREDGVCRDAIVACARKR